MAEVDCSGIAPFESAILRQGRNRLADKIKDTVLEFNPDISYLDFHEAHLRYDLEFSAYENLKTRDLDKYVQRKTGVAVSSTFQRTADGVKLVVTIDKTTMFAGCCSRYSLCQSLQIVLCLVLLCGFAFYFYTHPRR